MGPIKAVALLFIIRYTADCVIRKEIRCPYGRYVSMKVEINNTALNLICLYAPNNAAERKEFIANLDTLMCRSELLVLGGDFNFVENNALDKCGGNTNARTDGFVESNAMKANYELCDIFRKINLTTKGYSWSRGQVASRLDRFYLPNAVASNVTSCDFIHVSFSDHSCLLRCFL